MGSEPKNSGAGCGTANCTSTKDSRRILRLVKWTALNVATALLVLAGLVVAFVGHCISHGTVWVLDRMDAVVNWCDARLKEMP